MKSTGMLRTIALLLSAGLLGACTSLSGPPGPTGQVLNPPASASHALPPLIPIRHLVADWNGSGAYQISPDGERLLWVARLGLGPGLFVKHLRTGQVQSYRVPAGGKWARDSRHIVVHLQSRGDENTHVWLIDTDRPDQAPRDVTPFAAAKSFVLRHLPHSDDLIISSNRRDPKVFDLYRYRMDTGALQLLATNPGNVGLWLVDDAGQVQGRGRLEGMQWVFEAPVVGKEEAWQARFTADYFDSVQPIAASSRPGFWWALSNRGRDKTALVEINLHDGSERVEFADAQVDVSAVVWSHRRQKPLAVGTEPDVQRWHAFDPALQQALNTWQPHLAAQDKADLERTARQPRIAITGFSEDERWMHVTVLRHDGGEHLLYDLHLQRFEVLAQLGRSRISVTTPLPVQQPVRFQSRDGLVLQGYLSEPVGVPKPYPTVVYVHGGPWARDLHNGGDPMLPFLTNRGYAVLQVNYRGSSGYGKAFMQAAQGEFARKMHTDLTDALAALVAQGVADPARVAIAGASYGGYASLVGMTHTPGVFRCAVSTVGVSDLAQLLTDAPPYWELSKPHWIRYVGDPADAAQRADMQERSPLHRASRVQGPVLLLHGLHDPRVKVQQSLQMAQALKAHGKAVELRVFDKAGHGFERWQDALTAYRTTEDFLARCLGGRSRGFDFFELGARLF